MKRVRAGGLSVAVIAGVVLLTVFGTFPADAKTYTFNQQDWSGGTSLNTATHPADESGWNQFASSTNYSASTDISLSIGTKTVTQQSGADFNAGAFSNTLVNGSSTQSSVILAAYPSPPPWTTIGNTPVAFGEDAQMVYPGYGNYIYVSQGAGSASLWRYSVLGDSWTQMPDAPGSIGENDLISTGDDYIYAAPSGLARTGFWRYSISQGTWSTLSAFGPIGQSEWNYNYYLTYSGGGVIYADAVLYGDPYDENVMAYNISNDSWSAYPVGYNRSQYTTGYSFCTAKGGIYGFDGGADGTTGFQNSPPGTPGDGASCTYPGTGDYIYALQGGGSNAIWRYSISQGTWTTMTDAPGGFSGGGTIAPGPDGNLYALQGGGGTTLYRYSPLADNGWSSVNNIPGNSTNLVSGYNNNLYAPNWDYDNGSWNYLSGGPYAGGAVTVNGNIYVFPPVIGNSARINTYQAPFFGYSISQNSTIQLASPNECYFCNIAGSLAYPGSGNNIYGLFDYYTRYAQDTFQVYSIGGGWGGLPTPPTIGAYPQITNGPDSNYIYAFPGDGTANFYRYSISAGTWSSMANAPGDVSGGSLIYPNDGDYIFAVQGGGSALWRYTVSDNTWDIMPNAPGNITSGGYSSLLAYPGTGNYLYAIPGDGSSNFWGFDFSAYPSTGTFTSSPIDIGDSVSWGSLQWNETGGETLTMEARSFNDPDTSDAPDWSTCSQISNGQPLASGGCVTNGDAYIQYKATLSTTNTTITPSLNSVTISYNAYLPGAVISSPYNTTDPSDAVGEIDWTETVPTNTGVALSVRVGDNASDLSNASWVSLTDSTTGCATTPDGSSTVVACSGVAIPSSLQTGAQYWQYKVAESSTGAATPTVSNVTVKYVVNAPPQFNADIGGGTGVTALEQHGTSSTPDLVQFQFSGMDSDSLTDNAANGHATSTVTPSYQYSLNGGSTWNPMNTFITPDPTEDISMLPQGDYSPTSTIVWNSSADVGQQYSTDTEVLVTLDDHQLANHIATATSVPFVLDTNPPAVNSLTMDVSQGIVNFNFSADANFSYRLSSSPFTASTPDSILPFVAVGGDATNTSAHALSFGNASTTTSTPVVYVELEDVYGNDYIQTFSGPAMPSGLVVKDITNLKTGAYGAYVSWATSTMPDFKQYDIYRSVGGGAFAPLATISSAGMTSYTDTGLMPSTAYTYEMRVEDTNGNISAFTPQVFVTSTGNGGGPAITLVSASPQDTSAVVTWDTNTDSDSYVFYSTSTDSFSMSAGSADLVSGSSSPYFHSVSLPDLVPDTTYYYYVQSTDASGLVSVDKNGGAYYQFATTNSQPPQITNVNISFLSGDTAGIAWTTDKPSDTEVSYGTSTGVYPDSISSSTLVTAHQIFLTELTPDTMYHYVASSVDAAGNAASSSDLFFTTQAPVFSDATTTYVGDTSAIVTWDTTMDSDSYVYYFDPTQIGGGVGATETGTSTFVGGGGAPFQHTVSIDGLIPGTTYYYYLQSDDANDIMHIDNNFNEYYTFTTTDHTPPVLSYVKVPVMNETSAIVTWNTDKPSTSWVEYGIESGEYSSSTTEDPTLTTYHAVTLTGLTASTTYYLTAHSKSNIGVEGSSGESSFSTLSGSQQTYIYVSSSGGAPAPDITPPTITNVTATSTAFNATVSFNTSKSAIGFVEYGSGTNFGYAAADGTFLTSHAITLSGLLMGTNYSYYVKAIDNAGNTATSSTGTFMTQYLTAASTSPTTAYQFQQEIENSIASALPSLVPPFLSTPAVSNVTENSAEVDWTTNINSYSVLYYAAGSNYDPTSQTPYPSQTSDVNDKVTDHVLNLTDLLPNTTYHIMAESFSIPGVFGKSKDITFTTAASKVTADVTNVTTSGFNVTWVTDMLTSSVVQYEDVKTGTVQTITDNTPVTIHDVQVQNLPSAETYQVSASGETAEGNPVSAANNIKVTTLKDTTPPKISNIKIQTIIDPQTPNVAEAIVGWSTDKPSNSIVNYDSGVGSTQQTFSHTIQDLASYTLTHVVIVPNLTPGAVYRVQISSTDQASNTAVYPTQTIVVSEQSQSILDVILNNFENTFQFLQKVQP